MSAADRGKCAELGIELNPRKTRVVKLTRGFTWLKKRIFYTETGRIVVKPCRDSITRERRKLKKMARMVADGIMTPEQVEQSYQSWRGGMKRLDAHRSVRAMDALYRNLFGNPAGGVAQCNPNLEATRMEHAPTLATEGATHDGTGNRRGDQRLQTAA